MRRAFHPIYICAPGHNPLSGGVRALHVLHHVLKRNGFDAYLMPYGHRDATGAYIEDAQMEAHKAAGKHPIYVYPEVISGNPHNARHVVRFLLNKPGLVEGEPFDYKPSDFFVHYAPEHVPAGAKSHDLYIPLVDRACYFSPAPSQSRSGFVAYVHRVPFRAETLPEWASPLQVVSMEEPRPKQDLAELYRHSRAAIFWERSSAIFEALACGCPAICISGGSFNRETYQPRFRGAGLVWGWDQTKLNAAAEGTNEFQRTYRSLEESLDRRVESAFSDIIHEIDQKTHLKRFLRVEALSRVAALFDPVRQLFLRRLAKPPSARLLKS